MKLSIGRDLTISQGRYQFGNYFIKCDDASVAGDLDLDDLQELREVLYQALTIKEYEDCLCYGEDRELKQSSEEEMLEECAFVVYIQRMCTDCTHEDIFALGYNGNTIIWDMEWPDIKQLLDATLMALHDAGLLLDEDAENI